MKHDELRAVARATRAPRASGKTRALARAALEIGAYFVVSDESFADYAKTLAPGVKVITLDKIRGMTGPFIFDHYVLEQIFVAAAYEIDALLVASAGLMLQ